MLLTIARAWPQDEIRLIQFLPIDQDIVAADRDGFAWQPDHAFNQARFVGIFIRGLEHSHIAALRITEEIIQSADNQILAGM